MSGAIWLLPTTALADAPSHEFAFSFGDANPTTSTNVEDPYPIEEAGAVAVDQATGDVYVGDSAHHRVEKFDPEGHFLLMFGKEVNRSGVELRKQQEAEEKTVTVTEAQEDVCDIGEPCQVGTAAVGRLQHAFSGTMLQIVVDNSPSGKSDVYVDYSGQGQNIAKFDPEGHSITAWRSEGILSAENSSAYSIAVDQANGDFYAWASNAEGSYELTSLGELIRGLTFRLEGASFAAADSSGNLYFREQTGGASGVAEYDSSFNRIGFLTAGPGSFFGTFAIDPSLGDFYLDTGTAVDHYDASCEAAHGPCQPLDSFGAGAIVSSRSLAVDGDAGTVYVTSSPTSAGEVLAFSDLRPLATTEPPTAITETGALLHGSVDPRGHGEVVKCRFEYGLSKAYEHTVPCEPNPETEGHFPTTTPVHAAITGLPHLANLPPGAEFHYRLLAENAGGTVGGGRDQSFLSTRSPAVKGLSSGELTATAAHLTARLDPDGLPTKYHFEWGTTTAYGESSSVSEIAGGYEALNADHTVEAQLSGLQQNVTYHYRLLAENADGETVSPDDTFSFFPPTCPNQTVRQQTHSAYLPDCRAYELVSPPNAGATQLFPGGPNTGQATSPSRLAYVGANGTLPGTGGSPIDANGDLYIATRTDTGWVSRYVGLPSSQAALDGGPPQGPPDSGGGDLELGAQPSGVAGPAKIQNGVLTDPSMDAFLEFNDGNQGVGTPYQGNLSNTNVISSNAPFLYGAEGSLRERLPTDLGAVPGASQALDCPAVEIAAGNPPKKVYNDCPGDVTASADLSHFVFATETGPFAPAGQLAAPGSVYDDNTATSTVEVASKLPDGQPIPAQPADHAGDPLQIPAVSADGSHILIAAGGTGPCGSSSCGTPPCGEVYGNTVRCPMQPSNLYMRIDGALTYDVSQGHDVNYVGMTSDGSKVFFTSEEHLTKEDPEHGGAGLYIWSQKGEEEDPPHPLTLISKGPSEAPGAPGNTAACTPALSKAGRPWTSACGVVPYSGRNYCQLTGGLGGNCISDTAIASESGDVFFFSPEQLDGAKGIPNQWNLYDYRGGRDRFVAAFTSGRYCTSVPHIGTAEETQEGPRSFQCSNTPVVRMQVTPDGAHMVFVTASQVTSYDNTDTQRHCDERNFEGEPQTGEAQCTEMYTYEPSTEKVTCVSCNPSGTPPTSDVYASQDGLFLTNDGRTFFSTEESLVHNDTDNSQDVYEYVEGRPQLITTGTGDTRHEQSVANYENPPGLDGVSANGTDVYFSTYDTLVPQDLNGNFLKFYDARTDGGFPSPAPPPPCAAADECHSEGSTSPPAVQGESSAVLKPGNADPSSHKHHGNKHHKKAKKKRHAHRANAKRGGKK